MYPALAWPGTILHGMCNEDDNSSEIFLTIPPLKANDQDMSLRSSDQNIMKIPTDGFQGIQYNFCIFYISFISFHRTETTTSLLHTQHNTIRKDMEITGVVSGIRR